MKKVIKPARMPARNRNSAARQSKSNRAQPRPELPELARLAASADKLAEAAYSCPMLPSSYFSPLGPAPGRYAGALGEDLRWQMKPQGQRPETVRLKTICGKSRYMLPLRTGLY
jgi:hypothetical protein